MIARRRFLLIGNRLAGRGRQDRAAEVVRLLRTAGTDVELLSSAHEADALDRAVRAVRAQPPDAVIAAGGDGTVRLSARAIVGTGVPLGFIPLGTGNVLAHELGMPLEPNRIAQLLLEGEARPVHTATANGELFLLMAGVGFDGRVIHALDHRLKNRLGKIAYLMPMLGAWRAPPDQLEVEVDGRATRATWVIVANACRYGGGFRLAPGTSITQPGLEVLILRGTTSLARLREMLAIARGGLGILAGKGTTVEIRPGTRIRIGSARPVPCQLDGDAFGVTPLEISAGGGEVRLIWPEAAKNSDGV